MRALLALAALAAHAAPAQAEVVSATADAFTVRNVVRIAAPPARVYAALGEVGRWWEPSHSWSGDPARNMTLELKPGGCFCETLPGGGAEHMRVVFAKPGETLRLAGALGPLQDQGVSGALTFALKAEDGGTTLTQTYVVRGFSAPEATQWAPPVDRVLSTQLGRLQRFTETGRPDAPPSAPAPGGRTP